MVEKSKEKLNLRQKLVEIRKTIDSFYKDTKGYNYKYVSGSQVLDKIKNKMEELQVLLIPDVEHNANYEKIIYEKKPIDYVVNAKMTYTWMNAESPKEVQICNWSLFGKQDDPSKAFGSGLTYSERYFLMKFFGIPTDDEDPDAKQEPKQVAQKTPTQVTTKPVVQQKTPTKPASVIVENEEEDNAMADNVTVEEGIDFCNAMIKELAERGTTGQPVTVEDIKKIGVELQNRRGVDNTDANYIKVRDTILTPQIILLNKKK